MGVEGVGVYVWRQFNPLLEQAAARMTEVGINPQEFFA